MDKQNFNILLGSFIKAKRLEKKWSQPDLAAKVGNNYQNISAIERGEVSPTLYWLSEVLSPALEMTSGEFLVEFESYKASYNHTGK